jgi:hypothetical protein
MDIPIRKGVETEPSEQDACFHVQSQILPCSKGHYGSYRMSYRKSFEPLLAHTLLKKTLNANWAPRHFLLTATRLLYFTDSSLKHLKGCFILASLLPHRLSLHFAPPQIT